MVRRPTYTNLMAARFTDEEKRQIMEEAVKRGITAAKLIRYALRQIGVLEYD